MYQVPSSLAGLLSLLSGCFTQPSFETFGMLVIGSVARVRDCTVTGMLEGAGLAGVWRGAIVGHLALFEMESSLPNRRYADALRRLGCPERAAAFFDEHVRADAIHENVAAVDLAGGLARQQPQLAPDILWGAATLVELDARLARHVLGAWEEGVSSLRAARPAALEA
ncbi:MAG: iron-containing redox enzyme family protein [Actinomycetota bacterium]|nr:iron-containing redox enzyme family protein [Actinomycetota bacterium]